MNTNRICKGICKKFAVPKPSGRCGRYESGQCRCQTCDIWMDHRGCKLKDGSDATNYSEGWYCQCCNFRVRRKPRKIESKAKLKNNARQDVESHIDLSYFNKRRAEIIQTIVRFLHEKRDEQTIDDFLACIDRANITMIELKNEFDVTVDEIIELAYTLNPPNKISLIKEFERVRNLVNRTPTKQDIEKHTTLHHSQYEEEFGSWQHLLERLGDDPWYRSKKIPSKIVHDTPDPVPLIEDIPADEDLDEIRKRIRNNIADRPDMLKLFDVLDINITGCDKKTLRQAMDLLD